MRNASGALVAALVEAAFAVPWFSWGGSEADVPDWLGALGVVGSVLGIALLVVALVALRRLRRRGDADSAPPDRPGPTAESSYRRIVLAEVAALVVGAIVLFVVDQRDVVVVWFAVVVGVHFVPLGRLYRASLLYVAGVLIVSGGVAGLIVGALSDTAPVTVTGNVVGLVLVVTSALTLLGVHSASVED